MSYGMSTEGEIEKAQREEEDRVAGREVEVAKAQARMGGGPGPGVDGRGLSPAVGFRRLSEPDAAGVVFVGEGEAATLPWPALDLPTKPDRFSLADDPKGCRVVAGACGDFYGAQQLDPRDVQIDHVLPVAVARRRRQWNRAEWKAFYNDQDNLRVTSAHENESKGDLMPDRWCPASRFALSALAESITATAMKYDIPLTIQETSALTIWRTDGLCVGGSRIIGAPASGRLQP